jgi:hypothetical protein
MHHFKETDSLLRSPLHHRPLLRRASLRKLILSFAFIAVMVMCGVQPASADEGYDTFVQTFKARLKKPKPMQTSAPMVYASAVPGVVALYYQLYDGNWCYQHVRKDHLLQALDTQQLPLGATVGQVQCFKRGAGF